MGSIVLPFTGKSTLPPPFAVWLASGLDPHSFDRPRVAKDEKGYDCNDYAYDAVQELIADARDPYYIACTTEESEPHMIAAYATEDGVIYARDNRTPDDVPIEDLIAKGYELVSAANRKGELWRAPA